MNVKKLILLSLSLAALIFLAGCFEDTNHILWVGATPTPYAPPTPTERVYPTLSVEAVDEGVEVFYISTAPVNCMVAYKAETDQQPEPPFMLSNVYGKTSFNVKPGHYYIQCSDLSGAMANVGPDAIAVEHFGQIEFRIRG